MSSEDDVKTGTSRRDFFKNSSTAIAGLAIATVMPTISKASEILAKPAKIASVKKTKPVELVFHEVDDHNVNISNMWMQEVERRCDGQVHFTKYVGRKSLPKGVTADVFRDVPSVGRKYILMDLLQLPFMTSKSVDGSRILAQLYKEFPALQKEISDYKVVGLGTGSTMGMFSTKKWGPLKSMADIKSSRSRSLEPIDPCLAQLGAQATKVTYPQLKEFMSKGLVETACLGLLPAQVFNLCEEVAPYCTIAKNRSVSSHPMRCAMNWESWNKLPEYVKKVIDELGPAGADCWYANQIGPEFDKSETGALNYIRKTGQLFLFDDADLDRCIDLMKPGVDIMIRITEDRGLPGRKFVDRLLELSAIERKG